MMTTISRQRETAAPFFSRSSVCPLTPRLKFRVVSLLLRFVRFCDFGAAELIRAFRRAPASEIRDNGTIRGITLRFDLLLNLVGEEENESVQGAGRERQKFQEPPAFRSRIGRFVRERLAKRFLRFLRILIRVFT